MRDLSNTSNSMPPDYYDNIKNPFRFLWHIKRFKLITKMIGKENGKILDIGCDSGSFTEEIYKRCGKSVIGIDINKESVKYGKVLRNFIKFLIADGHELPFKKESFHLVTCLEVLEHVKQFKKIIREAYRVLKPTGRIIVLVPNGKSRIFKILWSLWSQHKKFWKEAHINKFSRRDIKRIFIHSNFKINKIKTSHFGMLIAIEGEK
jgi:ubiquinone/menaquinone biosynthesis C-methylase UbiE